MSTILDAATRRPARGADISWLRGRSERLLLLAAGLGLLHHADHVLRYDHSGWPFRPEVSPFTFSLIAYPIIALILALRAYPRARIALTAVTYLVVQATHLLVEPPSHQYGTWARGYGITPSGATPSNLLELASPTLGVLSVALAVALSLAVLAALVSLVADLVRRQ
jgi:hypothetical protein